jgi:hypothetical protein
MDVSAQIWNHAVALQRATIESSKRTCRKPSYKRT